MTESDFLLPEPLPFCGGCGHALVVRNVAGALRQLGLTPLNVVLVTDIGCHGIVDRFFLTHTVHGLHGRAAALGAGIAARTQGKVVVFMGDGGASIGLQHLVECATRNSALTVVVHNNMLYGMTGGQPSAVTPCGFRTAAMPDGKREPGYDLCRIMHAAGATYVRRIEGVGDFSAALAEAFSCAGFSLVEVIESCPSYGTKQNPGRRPAAIALEAGLEMGTWRNPERPPMALCLDTDRPSLLDIATIPALHRHALDMDFSILLAGSAGGRVQQAAESLARAAISAGLYATKKGSYPVTVGTGYSVAELLLTPRPILFTGTDIPDATVIVSSDGLAYARKTAEKMQGGILVVDDSLEPPRSAAELLLRPFRRLAGPKDAALLALLFLLRHRSILPVEALLGAARASRADLPDLIARLDAPDRPGTNPTKGNT